MDFSTYLCIIKQRSNDAALKKIKIMAKATKAEEKIIAEKGMSNEEAAAFVAGNRMWADLTKENIEAWAKAVDKWAAAKK